MIGKIMSEASHSIIGMLSAKPMDMETRTANNEFSSLLPSGADRSRLAVQDDMADVAKEARDEQFLEQFIGTDAKPEEKVDDPDISKTIGLKVPIEPSNGDTELASESLSPNSPAISETDRFISHLLPTTTGSAGTLDNAPLTTNPSSIKQSQTGTSADGSAAPDQAYPNANGPRQAEQPATENNADKQRLVLSEVGKVASIPLTIGNGRAGNQATEAALDTVQPGGKATAQGITTALSGTATPLPLSPMQTAGSERKIKNLLDLRVDSNSKADNAALRQISETETLEAAVIASEKPFKIDAKSPHLEIENLAVSALLDENLETVPASQSAAVIGGQSVTQKTVSFDWNAPQFAERFASEVSDLRINGDLKRFEINPRNMGRLEISLIAQGANEILQIRAESDAARDVIAQHSQAIQEMLKGQGRSDLVLRVDVKENMFSSSANQDMNFEQQDSAHARQDDTTSSPNLGSSLSPGEEDGPQNTGDNGRYA